MNFVSDNRRIARFIILPFLLSLVGFASQKLLGQLPSGTQQLRIVLDFREEILGVYQFNYIVSNPTTNTTAFRKVEIDISRPDGSIGLSADNLQNGQDIVQVLTPSELVHLIPVGLDSPANWIGGSSSKGTVLWGARTGINLPPGQSLTGFQITSRGLPSIRYVAGEGALLDQDYPISPQGQDDINRYNSELEILRSKIRGASWTVGPTAPPLNFVASDFIVTIQSYEEQAVLRGWIKNEEIANSLNAKLNAARQSLNVSDTNSAKSQLYALLNEVAQAGIQLTPEAVALLKYNTQYLISKLDQNIVQGDLNGDGRVDCTDIAILRAAFGKRNGQPGFNSSADLNSDGIVDVRDLAFVSRLLSAGTKCQ